VNGGIGVRVFSAVQPSGHLHIGNYTGGLMQFVRLERAAQCLWCIADLHALTAAGDPGAVRASTREVAALYLAAGLDPARSILFVQSHVAAHSQLAWILACTARVGELMRMTQYKARRDSAPSTNAGLFEYPILMAADILLYGATHVPVGADQTQHLELTRTLARRFNRTYGEVFTVPEPLLPEAGARIMALDAPTEKMSKTAPRDASRIHLTDPPDTVRAKIRAAVTDSYQTMSFDPVGRPGLANLLTLFAALSGDSVESLADRYTGRGHEALKNALADLVIDHLAPLQARYAEFSRDEAALDAILAAGAERAAALAAPTLARVSDVVGLLAPHRLAAPAGGARGRG
jgi:tryptophanyl-tRNA synthetase